MKRFFGLLLLFFLTPILYCSPGADRYTLLIKIPTKSRPDQFFKRLNTYIKKLSGEVDVTFLISCDVDDKSMHNQEIIRRFESYKNLEPHIQLFYYFDRNTSKIDAYNKDIKKHMDFDVLLVASDDMEPIMWGYDKIIIDRMIESFPDLDGVLNFYDGHQGEQLNTMPIMGKKYYELFGYIYHPDYKAFWCDNEFTEISKRLQRERVCDELIIEHKHPYWGTAKTDALYNYNNQFGPRDQRIYQQRRARNFGLDQILNKISENSLSMYEQSNKHEENFNQKAGEQEVNQNIEVATKKKWSILIPTLVERRHLFKRIYTKLMNQINASGLENEIEIVSYEDNREKTIGYKRNRLIEQSQGEYICFIDDDDDVSNDYIEFIYKKLLTNPDCVALEGIITFNGKNPRRFTHSIQYSSWFERAGVYYRPPNHLNPIKRSIAIQFKFPDIRNGEDHAWSIAIAQSGLIKTEAPINKPYYFYLAR